MKSIWAVYIYHQNSDGRWNYEFDEAFASEKEAKKWANMKEEFYKKHDWYHGTSLDLTKIEEIPIYQSMEQCKNQWPKGYFEKDW